MKLIKGDISLIITLNLLYLFCFIFSGILEFLYLLIFNIVILIIQIAYRNYKTKQNIIELTNDIYKYNDYNENLEEYLEEEQDNIIEKEEQQTKEETEEYDNEYDEDEFEEYEDSDIEEDNEAPQLNNSQKEYYEKISENNIKVNNNKNYTAIVIFVILAVIGFLLITFKNIDTIEPMNKKKEDKLNNIIGEWDAILKIENGFYITTIFIYGNNRCGGMSAITSDAGVQVLGSYTSSCYMNGNEIVISDSGATYYYNEKDNLLESYDTGAIYTKISTDPCSNIYASC